VRAPVVDVARSSGMAQACRVPRELEDEAVRLVTEV